MVPRPQKARERRAAIDVERELAAKEPDWASPAPGGLGTSAVEEDKVYIQTATKALYGSPDPPAPKRSFNPFPKEAGGRAVLGRGAGPSWAAPPAAAATAADDAAAAESGDDDSWPSADAPPVSEMYAALVAAAGLVPPPDVDGLPLPPLPSPRGKEDEASFCLCTTLWTTLCTTLWRGLHCALHDFRYFPSSCGGPASTPHPGSQTLGSEHLPHDRHAHGTPPVTPRPPKLCRRSI